MKSNYILITIFTIFQDYFSSIFKNRTNDNFDIKKNLGGNNMREKIFLSSAIVALLMLVSMQIVFLNTASSYPEAHEGAASVGTLWLSELDVSSDLYTVDYIGVPHVNATDDWVVWPTGYGEVIANWSVDIGNNHPEYYVIFALLVINADDNEITLGGDVFEKTYNSDTSYDESGSLSCNINLSSELQAQGDQTIVCDLGTFIKINDTIEAENFSIWSHDRCVLGVDSEEPRGESFEPFITESNEKSEPFWAYLAGWSSVFQDEDEMLNSQTVIIPGEDVDNDNIWDIGTINVVWDSQNGGFPNTNWQVNEDEITWPWYNQYWVEGPGKFHWTVYDHSCWDPPLLIKVKLKTCLPDTPNKNAGGGKVIWFDCMKDNSGTRSFIVTCEKSVDQEPYDEFALKVVSSVINVRLESKTITTSGYMLYVDNDATPPGSTDDGVNWYYKLAYLDGTYNPVLSGTNEINLDITNAITLPNQFLYLYAGDTGDTTITLTI